MIPVKLAPEPKDFDKKVRQRGLNALAELVGDTPTQKRRGRKRKSIYTQREEIPPDKFPSYWTEAIGDMMSAYEQICAYMSVYIEKVTGAASVDHMIPKSVEWNKVYEWDNYRLACSMMNSRKGSLSEVLDPTQIKEGWFALELVGFQVIPGETLSKKPKIKRAVENTIVKLGLCDSECSKLRAQYAQDYWDGHISLDYLKRRVPFVASELERQGRLNKQPPSKKQKIPQTPK
ncbi:MAG: hypothetical protein H6728_07245 [Myxococcales bacterium]|nr:hypothetical protein [Myxococcales bacterium]MCB9642859.1 hypothetical protein [Myxococcales bacterium]